MAFETRAGAERNNRHARPVGVGEHGCDVAGRFGKDNDVGPVRSVVGEVGGVLFEHGLAVADAPLVGYQAEQLGAQVGRYGHPLSLCQAGTGADSSRSAPSRMPILCGACAARLVSCVATMMVVPWRRPSPASSSITSAPVFVSRLPVGSSARITRGSFASARAMA